MATKVASLFGELNLRDNMTPALGRAGGSLDSFAQRTRGVGRAATLALGGAFAAGTAAITKFAVDGLGKFNQFERGMNEVFTLLPGISGNAMSQMEYDAKNLAVRMGVLPDEVVPALYQAISAGVPQNNVFDFLEIAGQAAIGGVTDLETAVDGITSVVNAYGDGAIDASKASDLMFTAVKLGKTDFEQLSNSLYNVIPTASGLGVGFENVTAALATLTAQGTPTSVATTQMRQMLVELGDAGTDVGEIFQNAAGESFKDFIAEGNNVADALAVLQTYADDTGVDINNLFGSVEAGNAALGLTGASAERFAAALDEMANSAGATGDAFDVMEQSGARGFDKLRAVFSVILIDIGERLAPAINSVADVLVSFFRIFEAGLDGEWLSDWIMDLPKGLQNAGIMMGKFGKVVGIVVSSLSKMRGGVDIFDALRETITEAFYDPSGPLEFIDGLERMFETITRLTRPISAFISSFVGAKDVLIALGIAVASFVLPALLGLAAAAAPIAILIAGVAALRQAWENNFLGIQDAVANVVAWVGTLKDAFTAGGLQGAFEHIFDGLKNLATSAWDAIKSVDWGGVAGGILEGIGNAISIGAGWVKDNILTPLAGDIVSAASDPNTWTTLQGQGASILVAFFDWAVPLATEAYDKFLSPLASAIVTTATDPTTWTTLGGLAVNALDALANFAIDIGTWVWDNLLSPVVSAIVTKVKDPNTWTTIAGMGEAALNSLANFAIDMGTWVWDNLLSPLVGAVSAAAQNPATWETLAGLGISMLAQLVNWAVDFSTWVSKNIFIPVASAIVTAAQDPATWETLGGLASNALNALVNWSIEIGTWVFTNILGPLASALFAAATNPETWTTITGLAIHALMAFVNLTTGIGEWAYNNLLSPLVTGIFNAATNPDTWVTLAGLALRALTAMVTFTLDLASWVYTNLLEPFASAMVTKITDPATWEAVGAAFVDVGSDIIDKIGEGLAGLASFVDSTLVQPFRDALADINSIIDQILEGTGYGNTREDVSTFTEGILGHASGTPWTGNMGVNQFAGIVHGQEAVVPHGGMYVTPSPAGLMLHGTGGYGGGGFQIGVLQVYANDVDQLFDQLETVRQRRSG